MKKALIILFVWQDFRKNL